MALCTAAEVRAQIREFPSGDDSDLTTLIGYAEVMLARYCGYPPAAAGGAPTLESATYTRYSGDTGIRVCPTGRELYLEPWPVTSITSIHDDPGNETYTSTYLVDSGDYVQRGNEDQIVRLLPAGVHGAFSTSPRAIKVIFVAGYANVRDDLKACAIELTAHMWNQVNRRGLQSMTGAGGLQTAYVPSTWPKHVLQWIAPYRLPSVYL